ncbi:hypothetical protein IKG38_02140 [Candidatus Saccharibacteria bacterium]|nr:hypothetical protein [Candidatus Saccharibacteria bacterium]
MEFVRVKYANNKLINAEIKEHREIIEEYTEKKGYKYVGFIPVIFGPSGKTLEADLLFEKPKAEKEIKEPEQKEAKK